MMALLRAAILASLVGLFAVAQVSAQALSRDAAFATTTLDLSAQGEAKIAPDMATISLGVETTATNAAQAMRANADKMARMLAAVQKAGVAARDLQTSSLGLSAQYAYEQGRAPRATGYQASNQLIVTVRDLANLGPIVDAASGAGATTVSGISFGLTNPVSAENTARIAAVKAVQDKASLYAQAVGYHIVRLVNLSEGGGYAPSPPRPLAMARMVGAAAPTPVEPGEMTVRIEVTAVFELAR
ncbi:MAG TPA: SIMPL domain-containing protein [Caulobacteraceae bacterium]